MGVCLLRKVVQVVVLVGIGMFSPISAVQLVDYSTLTQERDKKAWQRLARFNEEEKQATPESSVSIVLENPEPIVIASNNSNTVHASYRPGFSPVKIADMVRAMQQEAKEQENLDKQEQYRERLNANAEKYNRRVAEQKEQERLTGEAEQQKLLEMQAHKPVDDSQQQQDVLPVANPEEVFSTKIVRLVKDPEPVENMYSFNGLDASFQDIPVGEPLPQTPADPRHDSGQKPALFSADDFDVDNAPSLMEDPADSLQQSAEDEFGDDEFSAVYPSLYAPQDSIMQSSAEQPLVLPELMPVPSQKENFFENVLWDASNQSAQEFAKKAAQSAACGESLAGQLIAGKSVNGLPKGLHAYQKNMADLLWYFEAMAKATTRYAYDADNEKTTTMLVPKEFLPFFNQYMNLANLQKKAAQYPMQYSAHIVTGDSGYVVGKKANYIYKDSELFDNHVFLPRNHKAIEFGEYNDRFMYIKLGAESTYTSMVSGGFASVFGFAAKLVGATTSQVPWYVKDYQDLVNASSLSEQDKEKEKAKKHLSDIVAGTRQFLRNHAQQNVHVGAQQLLLQVETECDNLPDRRGNEIILNHEDLWGSQSQEFSKKIVDLRYALTQYSTAQQAERSKKLSKVKTAFDNFAQSLTTVSSTLTPVQSKYFNNVKALVKYALDNNNNVGLLTNARVWNVQAQQRELAKLNQRTKSNSLSGNIGALASTCGQNIFYATKDFAVVESSDAALPQQTAVSQEFLGTAVRDIEQCAEHIHELAASMQPPVTINNLLDDHVQNFLAIAKKSASYQPTAMTLLAGKMINVATEFKGYLAGVLLNAKKAGYFATNSSVIQKHIEAQKQSLKNDAESVLASYQPIIEQHKKDVNQYSYQMLQTKATAEDIFEDTTEQDTVQRKKEFKADAIVKRYNQHLTTLNRDLQQEYNALGNHYRFYPTVMQALAHIDTRAELARKKIQASSYTQMPQDNAMPAAQTLSKFNELITTKLNNKNAMLKEKQEQDAKQYPDPAPQN